MRFFVLIAWVTSEDSYRPAHPWFNGLVSDSNQAKKKTFCGFSMGINQYWAGRVYDLCVYYMTGTPERSTESVFFLWRSRESNLRPLVYKA